MIQQGKQAAEFGKYQAAQANADANAAKGDAQVEAERIRQMGKRTRSAAIAALAGSGVDVNEGSALVIQKDITKNSEQDAQTTILGGSQRALLIKTQGQIDNMKGQQAKSASYIGAASTLAQGAATIASNWKSPVKVA